MTTTTPESSNPKQGKNNDDKIKEKDKIEEELSEEDLQLKSELEMLVERLLEQKTTLHRNALESMRTLIRTSTSSMTSVPKPLKFLAPHYQSLYDCYGKWPDSEVKVFKYTISK